MHSPDHARHPRRHGGRRGFTTLEVVAAAGLVSAGLVSIVPLYVRQTPNDLTGEHTCIMVKVRVCGQGEGCQC